MIDLRKGAARFGLIGGTLAVAALAMAAPGAARKPSGAGETVREALRAQGPIITDEERAFFRAKCGDKEPLALSSREGVIVCPDGKEVDDPEARAMMARILVRADEHVSRALGRREVAEAIDGEAHARVREQLKAFDSAEIREAVRRAQEAARISLAELEALDIPAIRADAMAAAEAALAEIDIDQIMRDAEKQVDRAEIDRALREAGEELARERRRLEARDK